MFDSGWREINQTVQARDIEIHDIDYKFMVSKSIEPSYDWLLEIYIDGSPHTVMTFNVNRKHIKDMNELKSVAETIIARLSK